MKILLIVFCCVIAVCAEKTYNGLNPNNRTKCPETSGNKPPNRVDTQEILKKLRERMKAKNLNAYLINNGDEHNNPGQHNMRIPRMSGFSGTSGFIIVTLNQSALQTDSRYFLQADDEMDCNWIMIKQDVKDYPSVIDFLNNVLEINERRIGVFANAMSFSVINHYNASLLNGKQIIPLNEDLVTKDWSDRPDFPDNKLFVHELAFSGMNRTDKINSIRKDIKNGETLVISDLPEIAWTFNLRADISATTYLMVNPLFYAFAMVPKEVNKWPTLFLKNFKEKLKMLEIRNHLRCNTVGNCAASDKDCVQVREYNDFFKTLENVTTKVILPNNVNFYVSDLTKNSDLRASTIQIKKAVKNPVEWRRYYECQVRDSAVVVDFLSMLENSMAKKEAWSEMSASNYINDLRKKDPLNKGVSFQTISSIGPNAAINHYRVSNMTNRKLTEGEMYLLDSGGQYLDGTTDVTRTVHFGTPKPEEILAYTTVLKASIDLADLVWVKGTVTTNMIDLAARAPIWKTGWGFGHGTGHGIGYFLTVHEGPSSIAYSAVRQVQENMLFSDEPGFYVDGKYGVRLETIVGVVQWKEKPTFRDRTYLTFEPATLVPFEPKLINYTDLELHHRVWLNKYNKKCMEKTGNILRAKEKMEAVRWLEERTKFLPEHASWSNSGISNTNMEFSISKVFGLVSLYFVAKYFMAL